LLYLHDALPVSSSCAEDTRSLIGGSTRKERACRAARRARASSMGRQGRGALVASPSAWEAGESGERRLIRGAARGSSSPGVRTDRDGRAAAMCPIVLKALDLRPISIENHGSRRAPSGHGASADSPPISTALEVEE